MLLLTVIPVAQISIYSSSPHNECLHGHPAGGPGQAGEGGRHDEGRGLEGRHPHLPGWGEGQGPAPGLDQTFSHLPQLHQVLPRPAGPELHLQRGLRERFAR